MKHVGKVALAILLTLPLGWGSSHATPLSTFATTDLAHDLSNFPVRNGIDYGPDHTIGGTLTVVNPERQLFALGSHYVYEHSLIVYFEFRYRFLADDGKTVFDDNYYFPDFFASPDDYIDIGWIPDGGLPHGQAFDGNRIITAFNATYRGLADNDWTIYGFRASVRHIYQPVPEPATLLLVGIAGLAGLRAGRKASTRPGSPMPAVGC